MTLLFAFGPNDFMCTYGQKLSIFLKTLEDHTKIMSDLLQNNKIDLYTNPKRDQKITKIVMEATHGMDHAEFSDKVQNFTKTAPNYIIVMTSKKNVSCQVRK